MGPIQGVQSIHWFFNKRSFFSIPRKFNLFKVNNVNLLKIQKKNLFVEKAMHLSTLFPLKTTTYEPLSFIKHVKSINISIGILIFQIFSGKVCQTFISQKLITGRRRGGGSFQFVEIQYVCIQYVFNVCIQYALYSICIQRFTLKYFVTNYWMF